METNDPVVVRMLVAQGSDGQTHSYALTRDRRVVADKVSVKRIEVSLQHARTLLLVTDTVTIAITSENLCMLISGRLWTEPTRGFREARRFAHAYPSPIENNQPVL
jgi:hypothetical protein